MGEGLTNLLLAAVLVLAIALVAVTILWLKARRSAQAARDALRGMQLAQREAPGAPAAGPVAALALPVEAPAAAAEVHDAHLCRLEVLAGPDAGQAFALPFDRSTIGADPRNSIPLTDPDVAKLHCEITFTANRLMLRDDDSDGGTLVNGAPIRSHPLEFGDRIGIGATTLELTCDAHRLTERDVDGAIAALEAMLERTPDFLTALKLIAFLLERDVARPGEADPYWKRIAELERAR